MTPEMISNQEMELRKSIDTDTSKIRKLIHNYRSYREQNTGDSLSPYFLLREADLRQGVFDEDQQALGLYKQFSEYYPSHSLVPRALLMRAYVYDEKLKDRDEAVQAYEELIQKYPADPLAVEAGNLLVLLRDTLTEEERVAKWLEEAISGENLKKK